MRHAARAALAAAAGTLLSLALPLPATAQGVPDSTMQRRTTMTRASGTFEVKMAPQPLSEVAAATSLGRMSLDKVFHGALEATSRGEMLAALTPVEGSAGYVAMERVTGTLDGREGSFVLQHTGTMERGAQRLSITVVPDSGTGALEGLAGTMSIQIEGGKHSYTFDYTLPAAP